MSAPRLELQQLSVGYRRRPLLPPMTATAEPGRVTVLLGPNGSGKSTLLRTIAGLQRAVAGRVLLGGADPATLDPRSRARRIAVVLTDRFDPGLLHGRDVVALGRRPYTGVTGALRGPDRAAVQAAAETVHAAALLDVPLAEMSDGQRQRVLIARALAQQPELLVLDEPSAFLDAPSRIELLEVLRGIAADSAVPVLVSTHDVEAALRVGQDAWVLLPDGLRAGTAQQMADGVISAAFDTPVVAFDRASTTFRLREGVRERRTPGGRLT